MLAQSRFYCAFDVRIARRLVSRLCRHIKVASLYQLKSDLIVRLLNMKDRVINV